MNENNSSLKHLQEVNLEMLKIFISICKKHNLCYYALGGTLLGAVRHGGFIPWDDDVDIGMPRPDYEKFLQIAPGELPRGYRLRTIDVDDDYRTYFVKVENTDVRIFREYYARNKVVKKAVYAWIDIMPIDGAPEGDADLVAHVRRLKRMRQMVSFSLLDKCMGTGKKRSRRQKLLMKFGLRTGIYHILPTKKMFLKFDRECRKYPYEVSKRIGNPYGVYGVREFVDRAVFGRGAELEFEDIVIHVPEDYAGYLTSIYDNYRELPSKEERIGHSVEFVE